MLSLVNELGTAGLAACTSSGGSSRSTGGLIGRSNVAFFSLLFSCAAFCQEFRGTISGVVTDPTGAAVAGANVIATETRTNTKTRAVSNAQGQYTVPFLAPGTYDVSAESQGFKKVIHQQIGLGPGDHPVIDIRRRPRRESWQRSASRPRLSLILFPFVESAPQPCLLLGASSL